MDLFSRITGSPGKQPRINDPKARFDTTKESCSEVKRISKDEQGDWKVFEKHVNTLISVFKEEQRLVNDDVVCAKWFIKENGLAAVSTVVKSVPGHLYSNIFALFRTLFDSDHETIIRDKQLIQATNSFLRAMNTLVLDRPNEEDFSQLMFIMVSKIKANPGVISEWFVSGTEGSCRDEVPLFYLLTELVYHEAHVGEYARTGLLYLVDLVASSEDLEKWVLESDLCTLIASGLGALYSQLSRGIVKLDRLSNELPAVVALSIGESDLAAANRKANDEAGEYRQQVDNFISYLQFWQDMISYCKSEGLKTQLLCHFDALFVRQLLYPSIVESTDNEGGYSIPTLTIFRHILEVLDHNELSEIILRYFLGLSTTDGDEDKGELLTGQHNEVLLTLRDIILTCLDGGENLQLVALQLLSVLIRKFYPYIVGPLLTVLAVDRCPIENIPKSLCVKELSTIQQIKGDIESHEQGSIQAYESDIELRMVNYPFLLPKQISSLLPEERLRRHEMPIDDTLFEHAIKPEDKVMRKCYEMLLNFFANPAELNLALTGVFMELGTCGWCTLRSWLLVFDTTDMADDNNDLLNRTKVLQVVQDLSNQYQHYSVTVDDFTHGVHEFERSLKLSEEITDAIEHENSGEPVPIVTTPVRRVTRSLSRLGLPKLRSEESSSPRSPKLSTAMSRNSSTSTLNTSLMHLDSRIRLVHPSAETRRSISSVHHQQVPSELEFDSNADIRLAQLFANIVILREFVNEIEALIHVRAWIVN